MKRWMTRYLRWRRGRCMILHYPANNPENGMAERCLLRRGHEQFHEGRWSYDRLQFHDRANWHQEYDQEPYFYEMIR